jgi:tetratricopeptide (TPR) repeat protein
MTLLADVESDAAIPLTRRERIGHRLRQWGCPLVDAKVHLAEAEIALREGDRVFEEITREDPQEADGWHYLADTKRRLGRLLEMTNRSAEAERAYRDAIAVHALRAAEFPDHPEFQDEWALSHFDLGRFLMNQPDELDAAILALSEATRLKSNGLSYWRELGIALYRSQRWAEAVHALEKPAELGGQVGDCELLLLAISWCHVGEPAKARSWFELGDRRAADNPDDETLQRYRSEAATLLGVLEFEAQNSP